MMPASPFFCRLCDTALASADAWRRHAKTEWHVYKLQCRIASPGTVVLPPSSALLEQSSDARAAVPIESRYDQTDDDGGSQDAEDTDSNADQDEQQAPSFVPDQCLFCGDQCGTFEENVAHMATTHSFTIPYQDCLAVDSETLVWYLHLVIYGYTECILCGTRRSTVEAVQQHMTAKGHCRFDISPDTEEFYEIPASENHELSNLVRHEDTCLRLPSGKLLSHRSQGNAPVIPQTSRQATNQSINTATLNSARPGSGLVRRDEKSSAILAARLSHLSTGDRNSLSHLPSHEVRSVLATRMRQLDRARRIEIVARSKVDRLGNRTLMKHFKNDVPGRLNG
ncbi:Cytoplasmic 60S subunit biogenesis factor REI1 [Tolypocladium ophioglossoides CBS 100239]|uniref:Cytoplasmic 60S subunit biogenesis factor REI1 n=1 Tax=Tolypocladium ophioglossoides (strain CBS 100239) TaxID=1163406 RepID=A0A0L0MZE8_TOLOC|nr:Cytoplasmic 60S subunit biogenesis factor REI1 [Tolypocladium ophioglossoides CBS 100239]